MKWTTKKPTVEGVYWHRRNEKAKPRIVEIGNGELWGAKDKLYVYWMGSDQDAKLDTCDGEWLGPIQPEEK